MQGIYGELTASEGAFRRVHVLFDHAPVTAIHCHDSRSAALALVQPTSFFPLSRPVKDPHRDRWFALLGHVWTGEKVATSPELARESVTEAGNRLLDLGLAAFPDGWGGVFALIAIDAKESRISAYCDPSGVIGLYYAHIPGTGLIISSHARAVGQAADARRDMEGIVQQLAFGYTIGRRTLMRGVFGLKPGETLLYDARADRLRTEQMQGFFGPLVSFRSKNEAADALFELLSQGAASLNRMPGIRGILLSGGFDSRLAAYLYGKGGSKLTAVTFGETCSHEVGIARRVAAWANTKTTVITPTAPFELSHEQLSRLTNLAETCSFPGAETAARALAAQGAVLATTGFLGETVLGGQGYALLDGRAAQRHRLERVVNRMTGRSSGFNIPWNGHTRNQLLELACEPHQRRLKSLRKLLHPEWHATADGLQSALRELFGEELNRLQTSNPETMPQVAERFHLEHHVRHFAGQERTLATVLPIALPTVYPAAFRLASNLPPGQKTDHGYYLRMVQRHFGPLARFGTATFPWPLTWPEPVLWAGRLIRQQRDNHIVRRQIASKGHFKQHPRFGWADFESWLRQVPFLKRVGEHLDYQLLDRGAVEAKLRRIADWDERVYSGVEWLDALTVGYFVAGLPY